MHFAFATLLPPERNRAQGYTRLSRSFNPAVLRPVCQKRNEEQRGRDWESLEIARFALGVVRNQRYGCVKAGETSEAAADEAGEDDSVEICAEADDEC